MTASSEYRHYAIGWPATTSPVSHDRRHRRWPRSAAVDDPGDSARARAVCCSTCHQSSKAPGRTRDSRCGRTLQVEGGSFLDSVPDGADAYVMKNDHPRLGRRGSALKILRNIRTAIAPDGKLLLLEGVLPERASSAHRDAARPRDAGRGRRQGAHARTSGRTLLRAAAGVPARRRSSTPRSLRVSDRSCEAASPAVALLSRTLYVEGHDSRVSSPTSGTPLLPILMSYASLPAPTSRLACSVAR